MRKKKSAIKVSPSLKFVVKWNTTGCNGIRQDIIFKKADGL